MPKEFRPNINRRSVDALWPKFRVYEFLLTRRRASEPLLELHKF